MPQKLKTLAPYEILAKVLSNRIREIIHDDGNQFAFVKDRNIRVCILIANGSVEDYHRKKKKKKRNPH